MAVRRQRSLRLYGPGNVFGRTGAGSDEGGGKNTQREEKGRRGKHPREGTFHDACYVRNLSSTAALSLLPLLRLRALGVIFQRTGKCSRYREKPARQTMHDNDAITFESGSESCRSRAEIARDGDGVSS